MSVKKVQKSGRSNFIYLPTSWCREFGISDGGLIHIVKQPSGELLLFPGEIKSSKSGKSLVLTDIPKNLIDKSIAAAYVIGMEKFSIKSKEITEKTSGLDIKDSLVGTEIVALDEKSVDFVCTVELESFREVLLSMIKKIISLVKLIPVNNKDLKKKLEDEVDRNSFLLERALRIAVVDPAYRKRVGLDNLKCVNYTNITSALEQIADKLALIYLNEVEIVKELEELFMDFYFAVSELNLKRMEKVMSKSEQIEKKISLEKKKAMKKAETKKGMYGLAEYFMLDIVIRQIKIATENLMDEYVYEQVKIC